MDTAVVRAIAQGEDLYRTVALGLSIKVAGGMLGMAAVVILGVILNLDSATLTILAVLALSIPSLGPSKALACLHIGQERLFAGSAITFTQSGLTLIGLVLCSLRHGGAPTAAAAYTISAVMISIWSIWTLIRRGFLKAKLTLSALRHMIRVGLPFVGLGTALILYGKIDTLILGKLAGPAQLGSYAAAYRVLDAMMFVPAAMTGALFPTLSRLSSQSTSSVRQACEVAMKYLVIIGFPLAAAVCILAPNIIRAVYGAGWEETAKALRILIWSWAVIFADCLFPVVLNATRRIRLYLIVLTSATAFNVILNLLLIPKYGMIGSSWATLVSELAAFAGYFFAVSRTIGKVSIVGRLWKPALSVGLLFAVVSCCRLAFQDVFVSVSIGLIGYCMSLICLGGLGKGDVALLRGVFLQWRQPSESSIRRPVAVG
jgi:O-antigen/teichoic acid export membrane protein